MPTPADVVGPRAHLRSPVPAPAPPMPGPSSLPAASVHPPAATLPPANDATPPTALPPARRHPGETAAPRARLATLPRKNAQTDERTNAPSRVRNGVCLGSEKTHLHRSQSWRPRVCEAEIRAPQTSKAARTIRPADPDVAPAGSGSSRSGEYRAGESAVEQEGAHGKIHKRRGLVNSLRTGIRAGCCPCRSPILKPNNVSGNEWTPPGTACRPIMVSV